MIHDMETEKENKSEWASDERMWYHYFLEGNLDVFLTYYHHNSLRCSTFHRWWYKIPSLPIYFILAMICFFRYPQTKHEAYTFNDFCIIKSNKIFNHKKRTVLYLHGLLESPKENTTQAIIKSHMRNKVCNLIFLDWSKLVAGNYLSSTDNQRLHWNSCWFTYRISF